jgi:hypothetical protein
MYNPSKSYIHIDQLQLVPLGGDTGPRRPARNENFL